MVQLPAVNTPQFEVVRNRLDGHARPVPPIYQPETIAEGILWAAERAPRELWIGWSTMKAIVGQRVVPGLLDRSRWPPSRRAVRSRADRRSGRRGAAGGLVT